MNTFKHCHITTSIPQSRRPHRIQTIRMSSTQAEPPPEGIKSKGLFQRLGQSFNSAGIVLFAKVAVADRPLAIPHLEVTDLRTVSWSALKSAGFQGCIFDKDNTLTEPYALELHPYAKDALKDCMSAFNNQVVLYSNSAGLEQFDPDGAEAEELERALGVPVLRHREKKPAGGAEDLEKHFGCSVDKLIMVGDRYLTDIVFGNRLGMLTIRQQPYTSKGEPLAVKAARKIEEVFVGQCVYRGVEAYAHSLAPKDLTTLLIPPPKTTSSSFSSEM